MSANTTQNIVKKAMERKMALLEQRLIMVEQFVEMRFCESFRDFTVRKTVSPQDTDSQLNPNTLSQAKASSQVPDKNATTSSKKELIVRIVRVDDVGDDGVGSSPNSPPPLADDDRGCDLPSNIKVHPPASDEEMEASHHADGDYEYFVFPPVQHDQQNGNQADNDGDDDDPLDTSGMDPNDPSDSDYEDVTPSRKRARNCAVSGSARLSKKRRRKPSSEKQECPVCHTHWKASVYDQHLLTHTRERHLKCSFCVKRFFTRKHLIEHEKSHQRLKFGKKCRVAGCKQICLDVSKQLVHERRCIRRALETGKHVAPNVIEDVKRRSQYVTLNWPESSRSNTNAGKGETEGGLKRSETNRKGTRQCPHCEKNVLSEVYSYHLKTHSADSTHPDKEAVSDQDNEDVQEVDTEKGMHVEGDDEVVLVND